MEDTQSRARPPQLMVILIAAVLQGWALYGLHFAVKHDYWPSTQHGWLIGLYAFWIFGPLTVQLLADHARQRTMWALTGLMAVAFFYFGWHYGSAVAYGESEPWDRSITPFALACSISVLWLMVLPFLQGRLLRGVWRNPYLEYFSTAWRNKLMLAEAGLFTGILWLLLFLWATLFKLLKIDFFQELFTDPLFVYPVTALAFGIALHLIGSLERLVTLVLEQLLGLLKWLAVISGLILALFTVALLLQLPDLLGAGRRVISSQWLLWLLAVMVLLFNAAYRDGSVTRPYPPLIATGLRLVAPLMVIVALTALYSLGVRIAAFGLTVDRIWGLIVALAALAYSIGYTYAAVRSGNWMNAMGRVNIAVALGLIAVIALTLTPSLSPYRLSAASQYRQALDEESDSSRDAFRYLRFSAGRYGIESLNRLTVIDDHPRAEQINKSATRALAMKNYWEPDVKDDAELLAGIDLFPAGSTIDDSLRNALTSNDTAPGGQVLQMCSDNDNRCAGLYVDLDTDGKEEFVLLMPHRSIVYRHMPTGWGYGAEGQGILGPRAKWEELLAALERGDFSAQAPAWQDLRIGNEVLETNAIHAGRRAAIGGSMAPPSTGAGRDSDTAIVAE